MKLGMESVINALKRVSPLLKPLEEPSKARKVYALIPSTPGHDMPDLLQDLSQSDLTEKQQDGQTIMHLLATYRALSFLPADAKTKEVFLVKNSTDEIPLHTAAYQGCLDQVPRWLLTRDLLLTKDRGGATVIHAAAWAGTTQHLPQENLHVSDLELKLIDGKTLVHNAASKGFLTRLPVGWVTTETITARDDHNSTPIHEAALSGNLSKVPREFLTFDNLTLKDNDGDSPLSYGIDNEELTCIPDLSYPGCMNLGNAEQQKWVAFFDENRLTGAELQKVRMTWDNLEKSGGWQIL